MIWNVFPGSGFFPHPGSGGQKAPGPGSAKGSRIKLCTFIFAQTQKVPTAD
jgi:hypothetical protein